MTATSSLEHTHDLRLPAWGPYTKKYTGISHLPDLAGGLRFDLSVFPGYYRRQVLVPNAKWESGFHPWEAAPDLRYYSYRYELEWKDQVYCDVSFADMGADARLIRSEFVNNTAQPQNLVLHYMAYLNFPPVRTYADEAVLPCHAVLPPGALWLDALDYDDLGFAVPRPQDTLVYDGLWRGEVRGHGFVDGRGIGQTFGADAGDWVRYSLALDTGVADAVLLVRYRASSEAKFDFSWQPSVADGAAAGNDVPQPQSLPTAEDFRLTSIALGSLAPGNYTFSLVSQGEGAVELDGFVLLSQPLAAALRFEPVTWHPEPQITPGPILNSLILQYPDAPACYGLAWPGETPWEVRQLHHDELDRFLRYYVQEHVQKILRGNGQGHFTNAFMRPIAVPPGQHRVLYGMICTGSHDDVTQALASFSPDPAHLEAVCRKARTGVARLDSTPSGDAYRFSQERMAATLLTNVVYPVYTRRSFIRHYTPGKWWDCLYTWDSGFIALGLLELDIERAIDCLNAYTTPPGDAQAAFLHHGSMVPVQLYAFQELWNRTQDRALLEYFYPRMRQYYRFFAGRLGSSTTRQMKSGLLKTWDYFYNSGGWDDYPPQVYVHRHALEATTTPVISTSYGIRTAKILQMAARALGLPDDVAEFQTDIDTWCSALNRYAWDAEAGYFGYVCHTADGEPRQILRHESGQNFNMGTDGASPLFAGVCTPEQERSILDRLASPERMWTPIGLCTVDKTAAYYRVDGYWNGAVWFPHQWFCWRALLDLNARDFAARIAHTALETWKAEVDASYHCFEHFIVQSGRGAGWHQFGGLCTPVLLWYGAYHRPGRLTVGYDTWVAAQQFGDHHRRLDAVLEYHGAPGHPFAVIAAMNPDRAAYQVTWEGQPVDFYERYPGILEITLDGNRPRGRLVVSSP
ncbi:MAG: MGH1-like glycoside hydrolase domain-containing protein [Chloroflexota bacterium]